MITNNRTQAFVLGALTISLSLRLCQPISAAPPAEPKPGHGPIVNVAADGVVGCLVPPLAIDGTHSAEQLTAGFKSTIDHYADAQVPYVFLKPLQ